MPATKPTIHICKVCNNAFFYEDALNRKQYYKQTCSKECENKLKYSGKTYLIKNKPLTHYIKETINYFGEGSITTRAIVEWNNTLRNHDDKSLRQRVGRSLVYDFGYTKTSNTLFKKL